MMAGFCQNSNQWLDFLFVDPKSCPHAARGRGNGKNCNTEDCGYYKERLPTIYYKNKMKILKAF